MEPPITSECDVLREEVGILQAENHRLLNEVNELKKQPVIPESVIKAIWIDGVMRMGMARQYAQGEYERNRSRIADLIAEVLRNG